MELLTLSVKVVFVVMPHLFPVVVYILTVVCSIQNVKPTPHCGYRSINHWRHCLTVEGGFLTGGFSGAMLHCGQLCQRKGMNT